MFKKSIIFNIFWSQLSLRSYVFCSQGSGPSSEKSVCVEFWIENPASINCSSLELPDILCEKDTRWRLEKIKHETKTKGLFHVFKSLGSNNNMVSATFRLQQSKRNFTLYNMATNLWFLVDESTGEETSLQGKFVEKLGRFLYFEEHVKDEFDLNLSLELTCMRSFNTDDNWDDDGYSRYNPDFLIYGLPSLALTIWVVFCIKLRRCLCCWSCEEKSEGTSITGTNQRSTSDVAQRTPSDRPSPLPEFSSLNQYNFPSSDYSQTSPPPSYSSLQHSYSPTGANYSSPPPYSTPNYTSSPPDYTTSLNNQQQPLQLSSIAASIPN
ncbi:uncharacterized protein LOC111708105 isoform X2 [Eurytemora carolleeae]|uniref:uncharacterized protein LOC111708105 isoform X2 n=1 Tax=Eurytemora carolleeae TaxID=1294199 RepID=UPI000C75E150|nr:uncharacterized protein LOC111708105 isoform X2 [Eurytemora carolleeae]|eukprot:XP_023337139.1 uncharacterized protein LOC111708105 isoform X2 [Eurytemora affinis]